MENHSSVNSSVKVGTSGAFTKVAGQYNVPCQCCRETQDYSDPLWEFHDHSWFCGPCAELAEVLLKAGENRSTLVFSYLINPLITKNGFDL